MAETEKLMQGNEAIVEGAIYAGMSFFAGYPITPSTEIAEGAAKRLPQVNGTFLQMEDEIAGISAIIGASAAGAKSMTATSGPGFSLKQEGIGYACCAELPCVIVDVQRSGPSTGLPTSPSQGDLMQARYGTHGDHPAIVLSPASVQEAFDLTVRCFNLAEKYSTPVILLTDEMVGHMREGIRLPAPGELPVMNRATSTDPERIAHPYRLANESDVPVLTPFGSGVHYNITGLLHDEDGFPTSKSDMAQAECVHLMEKVEANREDIEQWESFETEDCDTLVVCFGGTARSAKEAILNARADGHKVGMFRPVTVWPFPENALHKLTEKVKRIVVAELNYGQMVHEVERIAAGKCQVEHIGKVNGTTLLPDELVQMIHRAVEK